MMYGLFAFLLALPAVFARIEIDITASPNSDEGHVTFKGYNIDLISEKERNSFHLGDSQLKKAIEAYFGRRPSDAYLRSPTPWGDLYQSYNWAQVTRILTPERARILSISSEPDVVLTQYFHNNSSKQAEYKAEVSTNVQNTVSSTWQKDSELEVGQEIKYGFSLKMFSVEDQTDFSYTSKWGESASKSQSVSVGSKSGFVIALEPNQSVTAELYATKRTMKVQVDYEATLSGSIAANYNEVYKGHHFWSMDVNAVMRAAGLETAIKSWEVMELGYYSDARVVIKDAYTDKVMYSIPMKWH